MKKSSQIQKRKKKMMKEMDSSFSLSLWPSLSLENDNKENESNKQEDKNQRKWMNENEEIIEYLSSRKQVF